jgi:hypothetical protein
MTTEKQKWARRRNWLIRRLMGAKSIFSWDNINFIEDTVGREKVRKDHLIAECEVALDHLLHALRKSRR